MATSTDQHTESLTPKQRRFVEEYLQDFNATRAAIQAGYSTRSASDTGWELLRKPEIKRVLSRRVEATLNALGVQRENVLRELAVVCFSDPTHYAIDDDGNVTLSDNIPPSAMRAVSSIKKRVIHKKEGDIVHETEFRLWSKTEALKMMGQYFKLYVDKVMPVNPDGETPYDGGTRLDPTRELAAALRAALDERRSGTR